VHDRRIATAVEKMKQKTKLKIILITIVASHLYSCSKNSNIKDNTVFSINHNIKTNKSHLQDSCVYYKNPDLINFITSDYDKNGIKDSVFLSAKDSIVEFSIILNGKNKIKMTRLLLPMADYQTERKYNFFLFGNDSDSISLIQEYGAARDAMSYMIYFDVIKKEFIAKYIIYKYRNNKTGEIIEDTIFQDKLIERVDMIKYFNN